MSAKHNLEQWIAQLDYDDTCDISDRQVSDLIRNYAALEARCDALAAENVGLKSAIQTHSESTHFCQVCGKGDSCSTDDVCYALKESPETDKFVAEIRNEAGARAVELFAKTLGSPYTEKGEKFYEDGFTRAMEVVRDIQAPRFAQKLREVGQ
jgi:hypothetical protein